MQIVPTIWVPFKMETITGDYTKNIEGLNFILNHIKILCDNKDDIYDYFIKWIAQMIQYPAMKSTHIILISSEGTGKGLFLDLMKTMLGANKVIETSQPSRDVWGDFNGQMQDAFLVNLNELSKTETKGSEGKLKKLVTDPNITINKKGVNQFDIPSYHRFITTTNHDDPIETTTGDRRNLIIRASDEKKGDSSYFIQLVEYLNDVNVIRTCYDYFKNEVDNVDNFIKIKIPATEYQQNLKQGYRKPIDLWLEDFVMQNLNKTTVKMSSKDCHSLFEIFCSDYRIHFDINVNKFGCQLSNLKTGGVTTEKSSNSIKVFNIDALKKHYNIEI